MVVTRAPGPNLPLPCGEPHVAPPELDPGLVVGVLSLSAYPLVNIQKTMERSTMFNG